MGGGLIESERIKYLDKNYKYRVDRDKKKQSFHKPVFTFQIVDYRKEHKEPCHRQQISGLRTKTGSYSGISMVKNIDDRSN